MKKINYILILLTVFSFTIFNCGGSSGKYDDYKKWKHFGIHARSSDDKMFLVLQKEFGIDPPLESFYLEVDLRNPDYEFAKIGMGYGSKSVLWESLSTEVRNFIVKWEYFKENLNE